MFLYELIFFCILLIFISAYITSLVIHFSVKYQIYDVPGQRSSHDIPKPKCGGISIVLIVLSVLLVLHLYDLINYEISLALLIGLSLVSITGLIDDIKHLPVLIRVFIYFFATSIAVYLIGDVTDITLNQYNIELGTAGNVIAILSIVWITNLYNFMDGTDGFAAIQTICVALFCGVLFFSNNFSYSLLMFSLLSSMLGFIYWNWAPAKVFMGDVGSCAIGFFFGLFAIFSEKNNILPITVWMILLSPFIADATFTLIKRVCNKEKWYSAHNTHAYQVLYQSGVSHSRLALYLLLINIIIVWPFAYMAFEYKQFDMFISILIYGIIGVLWIIVQKKYQNKIRVLQS